MAECLKNGQIEVFLHGTKVQGAYALIKTRWSEGAKSQWLLIKMNDEYADARRNLVVSKPDSVLTGRTMAQIARGEPAETKKETGELQKKPARKKRVLASKKTQGE